MSQITVQSGYLPGTQSCRYHPVQHVTIKATSFNKEIKIMFENIQIQIKNDNLEHKIILVHDSNYNLLLKLDDKTIITQSQLYYVNIIISADNPNINLNDYITFTKHMIYDC
jgi:hypothetical protein